LLLSPRNGLRLAAFHRGFLRRRLRARRARRNLEQRHGPALPVDVEDDAVRIAELALEIVVCEVAEIEEELAAGRLDLLLLRFEVVALEAEMMDADELVRLLQPRADLALVLQQREVDLAVAHVDPIGGRPFGFRRALEAERLLVEIGGRVDVLDRERDVADAGGHGGGAGFVLGAGKFGFFFSPGPLRPPPPPPPPFPPPPPAFCPSLSGISRSVLGANSSSSLTRREVSPCSCVYCSSASMVGRFCSMPYGYQSGPMMDFSSSIIGCSQANDAFGDPVSLTRL